METTKDWASELYLSLHEYQCAKVTLTFACELGLIQAASFEALEDRCAKKNKENQDKESRDEVVYGIRRYNLYTYLQYELTQFKLDFIQCKNTLNYEFKEIEMDEKREFFEENKRLFTRWTVKDFEFEEVEMVIEKRLREAEYEENIKKLLYKLS